MCAEMESRLVKIAVDTTGGDFAPAAPVEAIVAAMSDLSDPDIQFIALGPREVIAAELDRLNAPGSVEIVDAPDVIRVDDPPALAVRRKRMSSIVIGTQMVAEGKADAFLSAGSTGALMVSAKLFLGTITGIERPALATLLPTWDGRAFLMLDLGAQTECTAQHLLQYGLMGSVYMEKVFNRPNPVVALLNIGAEPGKGSRVLQEAYMLLQQSGLNFYGNLESRNLLDGHADVVVCDGFIGNIVLKNMEGMALGLFDLIKSEIKKQWIAVAGAWLARDAFRRVRKRLDYSEYGGAPLLGVSGIVIKCHGSSNARALQNGIMTAVKSVRQGMIHRISEHLVQLGKAVT